MTPTLYLSRLDPLAFTRGQLYQMAQNLEGKRLSELDQDDLRVYTMLREHPEPGWVWLASEHHSLTPFPECPTDLIFACE